MLILEDLSDLPAHRKSFLMIQMRIGDQFVCFSYASPNGIIMKLSQNCNTDSKKGCFCSKNGLTFVYTSGILIPELEQEVKQNESTEV